MILAPFPLPPDRYEGQFMVRVLESIRTGFRAAVGKEEAVESLLLQAPNGSVWKVTVGNTGTLTTTAVPLGRS
jgi:hypothetical protein